MIRRILLKMANNGNKAPPDLGMADAIEAEDEVFKQSEALASEEADFDEKATRVENMTQAIRRDTGMKQRESGILPAQG